MGAASRLGQYSASLYCWLMVSALVLPADLIQKNVFASLLACLPAGNSATCGEQSEKRERSEIGSRGSSALHHLTW